LKINVDLPSETCTKTLKIGGVQTTLNIYTVVFNKILHLGKYKELPDFLQMYSSIIDVIIFNLGWRYQGGIEEKHQIITYVQKCPHSNYCAIKNIISAFTSSGSPL